MVIGQPYAFAVLLQKRFLVPCGLEVGWPPDSFSQWTIRYNDYATSKVVLLNPKYSSSSQIKSS